jgi:hypothetical protein
VVILYSEVNESEIDDIMNQFPKKHKKNDKQSFPFNELLFMGRRRIFRFTFKQRNVEIPCNFSQQESNLMLNYVENDSNIQNPIMKIYFFV